MHSIRRTVRPRPRRPRQQPSRLMIDYTDGELRLIVRQERAQLTSEMTEIDAAERELGRRRKKITARLEELDKAEHLLEGMR